MSDITVVWSADTEKTVTLPSEPRDTAIRKLLDEMDSTSSNSAVVETRQKIVVDFVERHTR